MTDLFLDKYRISSIRRKGHDYTSPGTYFITINTDAKISWFGSVANGIIRLSPIGEIVREEWLKAENLRDNITYSLKTGLSFDLPVLGTVRIPVSTSGDIPTLKLPAISLQSIKLKRLTLTGAELDLAIGINNPNSWGLIINTLQYGLTINQAKWIDGHTSEKTNISGKNENTLHIPFTLNFLQIGASIYQEISSGRRLNYQFSGEANLSSSLEMLGQFNLPFDLSGKIDLTQ